MAVDAFLSFFQKSWSEGLFTGVEKVRVENVKIFTLKIVATIYLMEGTIKLFDRR